MKEIHEFQIADKTMRKAHPDRFTLADRFGLENRLFWQSKVPQLYKISTNLSDHLQNNRSLNLPTVSDPYIIPILFKGQPHH